VDRGARQYAEARAAAPVDLAFVGIGENGKNYGPEGHKHGYSNTQRN